MITKIAIGEILTAAILGLTVAGCAHQNPHILHDDNTVKNVLINNETKAQSLINTYSLNSKDPQPESVSLYIAHNADCIDATSSLCSRELSLGISSSAESGDRISMEFPFANATNNQAKYSSLEEYSKYVKGNRHRLSKFLKENFPIELEYKFHGGPKLRLGADLAEISSKSPISLELRHSW